MAESKIEWTEQTWNPATGCTEIGSGCKNCYAKRMAKRLKAMGQKKYANGFEVTIHPDSLDEPLKTKKPTVFFVCSMGDLYHKDVPLSFVCDVYQVMERARKLGHKFLVLTKRAERMGTFLSEVDIEVPDHIYHGVTVCNQDEADTKIPYLLQIPGKRFLSIEPMLGPIDLQKSVALGVQMRGDRSYHVDWLPREIHQVLLGGETGKNARPMHPDWVRGVRDQLVPFMFKQWGEWVEDKEVVSPKNAGRYVRIWPTGSISHRYDGLDTHINGAVRMIRVGKNKAGRLLDGQLHDELIWSRA